MGLNQPRCEQHDGRPKPKIAVKQGRTRGQQESERQDQQVRVPRARQEIRDAQQVQTKPGRQDDGERRTRTAGHECQQQGDAGDVEHERRPAEAFVLAARQFANGLKR